jgi:23S rRNA (adenine2503-C2)-methyltransferase
VYVLGKDKINLKNYSPQEVVNLIQDLNEPSYRADQILDWIYKKKVSGIDDMKNLPVNLKEKLKREVQIPMLQMEEKLVSPKDGTVKYLYKTLDNELLECAVMKQDYGNTVCISSQIGCGLACIFCASTKGGMVRNLSTGEMLDQVILAEKNLNSEEKINNIVVMGMGEPLYNLHNLIKFLKTANNPKGLGISLRNITVSTAGIVPKIIELAGENLPITLAISLHAPDDETRSKLMPINKKYPLKELLESCKSYVDKVGRRITFEYILLADINDSNEKAQNLVKLISGLLCHVNLIPVNPVGEEGIKRPGKKRIKEFYEIINASNISVTIRKERGEDIDGACGQLRRRFYQGCCDGTGTVPFVPDSWGRGDG